MDLITELKPTDRIALEDDQLSIVEFYLPTCKACNNFASTYEELAQENQEVKFYKMNVTSSKGESPSQTWKVRAVPTVAVFAGSVSPDNELARILGNKPKETIQRLLEEYKPS
ncbi:thioredoxin family protein [Neorickettsia sennetsu]|uniref:Thioredoxin n=1 Tax=Ehrlichia sennetsu (strain ATCC VR-367 / Miyayama) TaxID=222891 RepID=Q2GEH5_EHRS3|nr:thioredoxin family protein [Neorickettsia sennetsu]ABD45818.1 thioredoxin [Neorickettsia sennetsu str. Miyayama]